MPTSTSVGTRQPHQVTPGGEPLPGRFGDVEVVEHEPPQRVDGGYI
jgi:hypothetical protein